MKTIEVHDSIADALTAIATYEDRAVADLVVSPLAAVIRDHRERLAGRLDGLQDAVQQLDGALTKLLPPDDRPAKPDGGKPARKATRKAGSKTKRTCDIDGCDRKHLARGMCSTHYKRWQSGAVERAPDGTLSPALEVDADIIDDQDDTPSSNGHGTDDGTCEAPGCSRPPMDGGGRFCMDHYSEMRDLVRKLRPRFGSDASREAADRIAAGRTS